MPSKKEIERWQLDRFVAVMPDIQGHEVKESEEPDFLLGLPSKTLGVELTELYHEPPAEGVPMQAQEALRFRIAKAAQRLYAAKGLPSLHVSIHFNPQYVPNKRDVERLSIAISDLVGKNVPDPGQSFSEEYDWENRDYFPEEVIHISAWNVRGMAEPFFSSPSASFVPTLEERDIERVLLSKESKVQRYRENCDEVWLLVSFDQGQLSTFFEHDEEVLQRTYASSFDRVFLLRHVKNSLHEIKVERAA
jgi:hypothetical protein